MIDNTEALAKNMVSNGYSLPFLLKGMSVPRKVLETKIEGFSKPIIRHLIKVLYYNKDNSYEKHLNDIDTWLTDIRDTRVKPKHTLLKSSTYYKYLFDRPLGEGNTGTLRTMIKGLNREGYLKLGTTGLTLEELLDKIQNILLRVSEDLSKEEFYTIRDYL